jgi:hypothetical protein
MINNIKTAEYPTNLGQVNLNTRDAGDENTYFNNFFDVPVQVSSNIDAAVIAYFEQITDNKAGARALASAVIYTSLKQGIDPMSTLDEFKKMPVGELNDYLVMFLNLERKGTSYLGVLNAPKINKYIARTILP